MWSFLKKNEYAILQIIAFTFLGIGVLVLVWFATILSANYKVSENFNQEITQTVGIFIGGVVPVFISIATVLLIYITFKSNREEFNKISEANNFQQFNTTFDSMCNSLIGVINELNGNKTFEDITRASYSEIINYLISRRENKVESKCLYNNKEYEVFNQKISIDELDNELVDIVESLEFDDFELELKIFKSGIILLFEHLERNLNTENLEENREFYIYRIKKILNELKVRETILFITINDSKLSNLSHKYNITENCITNIPMDYLVIKDGEKRVINYSFAIKEYYDKSFSYSR